MAENNLSLTLEDRRIIEITGVDATHFLERLITTDVEKLLEGELLPGALLSPQGKVLFDFLVGKISDGYLIDISHQLAEAFIKRLMLYKLRSDVQIVESTKWVTVFFSQNDSDSLQTDSSFIDKRFPENEKVMRCYSAGRTPAPNSGESERHWDLLRIHYGIAESGKDFSVNDVFPHDINFDQIGGISYKKGCYIGQEVVSRMHHRGTARRRTLIATGQDILPPSGTIEAEGKIVGNLGTVVGNEALALVRIDRVKTAMDKGASLTVEGQCLTLHIAPNMDYNFPENASEGE